MKVHKHWLKKINDVLSNIIPVMLLVILQSPESQHCPILQYQLVIMPI